MARGNVQTIPTGTQTLQRTLNAEVRNAIRVLNPNDGIVYVAINGQASPVTFDFVVPSQSYAALPGPWMEYGLYFLDQSGAGRTGVVTVYESDERLDFPDYHAIGRSLQAQVTSMDVVEGTQPPNPASGIARLWVDATDFLHVLNNAGTDAAVIDTLTALGGVLTGRLPNPGLIASVATFHDNGSFPSVVAGLGYNGSGGGVWTGFTADGAYHTVFTLAVTTHGGPVHWFGQTPQYLNVSMPAGSKLAANVDGGADQVIITSFAANIFFSTVLGMAAGAHNLNLRLLLPVGAGSIVWDQGMGGAYNVAQEWR